VNNHVFPVLGAAIAFKREVWDRFGQLLPGLRAVDLILPFRALLLGGGLAYVDEPLVQYRQHAGNHSHTRRERTASSNVELTLIEARKLEERAVTLQVMERTLREPTLQLAQEQREGIRAMVVEVTFEVLSQYGRVREALREFDPER